MGKFFAIKSSKSKTAMRLWNATTAPKRVAG
jgi:hypothetical protein